MQLRVSPNIPSGALLAALTLLAFIGTGSSSPLNPRADSSSSSTGSLSTSLPTVPSTTSSPTTASADPTATTTSPISQDTGTTTNSPSSSSTIESITPTILPSSDPIAPISSDTPDPATPRCTRENVGLFPPFCKPKNNTELYVNENFYVTWDVGSFSSPNITVKIYIDYVNVTGVTGQNAWESESTPKNIGLITVPMKGEWLHDNPRVNLSFTMRHFDPATKEAGSHAGPFITLTNAAAVHFPPPAPSTPNRLGVLVGIPVGLGFVALILCGLCIGMRKHRKINMGSIMGRKKGYGVGKSSRQRTGKGRGIQLQERELNGPGEAVFRDDPVAAGEAGRKFQGHNREESLGSLVNSPAREDFDHGRSGGNAFREEIARQQTGR